jgi:hypothetical protein
VQRSGTAEFRWALFAERHTAAADLNDMGRTVVALGTSESDRNADPIKSNYYKILERQYGRNEAHGRMRRPPQRRNMSPRMISTYRQIPCRWAADVCGLLGALSGADTSDRT